MTPSCAVERTILVVEDDPEILESLCDVLELEGYQVVAASNGQQALEQLRRMSRPCLVLLDLMLPVMDGKELLATIRQTDVLAALPVVIVSAWPKEARQVQHHSQGFVKKPVSLRALLEVVERFCARPGSAPEREAP